MENENFFTIRVILIISVFAIDVYYCIADGMYKLGGNKTIFFICITTGVRSVCPGRASSVNIVPLVEFHYRILVIMNDSINSNSN